MWLKVSYAPVGLKDYNFEAQKVRVELLSDICVPVSSDDISVRLSPIFPLTEDSSPPGEASYEIRFFEFSNPFQILGRINQFGSDHLKSRTYFSCGACAILLISDGKRLLEEFDLLKLPQPKAQESWVVK
ncbi:MAG: hypothetical protein ACREAC_21590, partial [Blastocatellia bacterium]